MNRCCWACSGVPRVDRDLVRRPGAISVVSPGEQEAEADRRFRAYIGMQGVAASQCSARVMCDRHGERRSRAARQGSAASEVLEGQAPGPAADLDSLGSTLYHLPPEAPPTGGA